MGEVTGWAAVVMALIAMVGTAVTTVSQRKAQRDKLEFDAERVRISTELEQCRRGREELGAALGKVEAELAECTKRHALSEARIAALQERIARIEGGPKP